MESRVSIVTPDHVEVDFEPAGLGSRMLALMLDALLMGLSLFVLILMALFFLSIVGVALGPDPAQVGASAAWVLAFLAVLIFLSLWGYFVLFEAVNRGQTPGKRLLGIRVVRSDGLPIGWREASLRNLVRFADIFPPPACIVGVVAIGLSRRGQRLGDLLAGTMVVREEFGFESKEGTGWEEAWVVRVEAGRSRQGLVLADTKITAGQLHVIERFLDRCDSLAADQRQTLAWRIAGPFLGAMGEDPRELEKRPDRFQVCERVLREILDHASRSPRSREEPVEESADDMDEMGDVTTRRRRWMEFDRKVTRLHRAGVHGLRRLSPEELRGLLSDYRRLACDLSRARSMGPGSPLVRRLNSVVVRAHSILYGHLKVRREGSRHWVSRFPMAVRRHAAAVAVASALFFGPAAISYVAVQLNPGLGYDLVFEGFLDFEPAREDSIHDIPSIARPIAASGIMTNNIQVTLLAFGLGLTAGIGTAFLLVFNGAHLGAVAGWMSANGNSRALWGWIFPHGGTELMAITLAGAAGFVLARAIIAPGEVSRAKALQQVAVSALIIELGVMGMLVVAGLIEGFVSPSGIGFGARIAVFLVSVTFWVGYLALAGVTRATNR
jgi:uncharacterized membrane protein SpoIIM required for sporulation/uncharacterized RDD family membrane protein YckC